MHNNNKSKSKAVIIIALLIVLLLLLLFISDIFDDKNDDSDISNYYKTIEVNGKTYVKRSDLDTVLLIGSDIFTDEVNEDSFNNNGQADFLMLLVIDKSTNKYYGIHINRDTMTDVRVLGVGGKVIKNETMQIALSHAYGSGSNDSCLNTVRAVSGLLDGITIDHYIAFTMDAVPFVNDYIGGVEVEILDDFSNVDESMIQGETITLNGKQALSYVRERTRLDEKTNVRRMERQRQYLNSMINKLNTDEIDTSQADFLDGLQDYITTDYSVSSLQLVIDNLGNYTFDTIKTIDGQLVTGEEYMEFYPDNDALQTVILESFYKEQ